MASWPPPEQQLLRASPWYTDCSEVFSNPIDASVQLQGLQASEEASPHRLCLACVLRFPHSYTLALMPCSGMLWSSALEPGAKLL